MAGERFLKEVSGVITEIIATQTGGAGNEDKIPSLDSAGLLPASMLPTGVGPDTASIVSSENLTAGDFVNIWDDGGTTKVRKAIADGTGKTADGFVLAGVTAPAAALVYFEGRNTAKSGLTGGTVYYLSASSAGATTATAPSGSGNEVQRLGKAYSTTAMTTEGLAGQIVKKA
jgi:hypothetical protein